MELVKRGEFKVYYTLVMDTVRRYLEARFGVEAHGPDHAELLGELERSATAVDGVLAHCSTRPTS